MADQSYLCVLCGHEFTSEQAPRRCPECLSATGIQELAEKSGKISPASPDKTGRPTWLVGAGLAAAVVVAAALGWFFLLRAPESSPGLAGGDESEQVVSVSLEEAPDPAFAGPEAKAYVAAHLTGAAEPAVALREHLRSLVAQGKLKRWDPEQELGREPLTGEGLLQALAEAPPGAIVGFEMANLALTLAAAMGLEADLVEEKGLPDTASSPLRKRFLARVAGQDLDLWAEDGLALAEVKRAPLTEEERRAFHQAHVALAHAEQGDFKGATSAIQRAMRLAPEQPSLQFLKGQITVLSGMVQFGLEDMEKAIAAAEDALGQYNLGVAYVQAQRFFKAHQALRRAIELDPKFVGAWLALASLQLARLPISPEEERGGLLAGASEAVDKARAIDPEAEGIAPVAAQILLAADDERGAFTVLDEAIRVHPERPQPYLMLASMLANQGKWAELVAYVKKGLRHSPDDPQLRHMLVMAYASQGRLREAAEVLTEALARKPEEQGLRVELAGLLVELDDRSSARRLLEEELTRFPDSDQAVLLVAQLDLEDGKVDEAIVRLDAVLAKEAGRFEALVLRYIAALKSGQGEEAPALLRRIAVAHESGRSFLAQLLLEQGMVEEGLAVLENVVADRPDSVTEAILLVGAYTRLGRDAEAARARAALLARFDDDPRLEAQLDAIQAEARRAEPAEESPEGEPVDESAPAPAPTPVEGLPATIEMPSIRMPSAPGEAPTGTGLPSPGLDLPAIPKLP